MKLSSRFSALRQIPVLELAKGTTAGVSVVHKFGHSQNIDTADSDVIIWDGPTVSDNYKLTPAQLFSSTTADIDSISSSNAGDTVDIEIQGLDGNYDLVIQTATLNGQTRVALATPLMRVFRAYNTSGTALAGDVYIYVDGAVTGGIPDTAADVKAIVQAGEEQTLMAVYTVPAGYAAYMSGLYWSITSKISSLATVSQFRREQGGVFRIKERRGAQTAGTGNLDIAHVVPEKINEKTDIYMSANASANNTAISAGFDLILVQD